MKKEKIVYILGAGFSKDAGGLLMTEFLRRAQLGSQRQRLNKVYAHIKWFMAQSVKDGLIGPGWNIEEFLNLVSEADLLNLQFKSSNGNNWQASKIYEYLVDCIVNELFLSMSVKLDNKNSRLPPHYADFAKRCLNKGVTIITFNWDHITEWLLSTEFGSLDYCLDIFKKVDKTIGDICKGVKLLKLHGSVNWLGCVNPNHPIYVYNSWQAHKARIDYCGKCNYQLYKLIVPPVWHKRDYAHRIGELWEIAADKLCSADRIIIIGYSLPTLDFSARHLVLLSSYLNCKLKVDIVNGPNFDDSPYRQIFKHAAQVRNTRLLFKDYVGCIV